jgi:hypothetical protein
MTGTLFFVLVFAFALLVFWVFDNVDDASDFTDPHSPKDPKP